MNSELGEKLRSAIDNKMNDITSFVWKLQKSKIENEYKQTEIRLIDATEDQLKEFYEHCKSMLFSTNKDQLGRVHLTKEIQKQRLRCGVELFLRYSESIGTSRVALYDAIKTVLSKNNINPEDKKHMILSDIINVSTVEYRSLPLELVMSGCLDQLGKFDKRYITLSFILKQGLCLTKEDLKDLGDLSGKNKATAIKENLNLPESIPLYFNETGLNYTQFRAIITLKNKKYSEMTTDQLKVLRNRILYALEDQTSKHTEFWKQKITEIEKVAISKSIELK